MNKFEDKDIIQLFQEFEENGYVEHICPDCGSECAPSEIDNPQAYCSDCDKLKDFEPVI